MKYLFALSKDRIVNVRITLAKVISKEILKKGKFKFFLIFIINNLGNPWILKNGNMITILKNLINDKSKGVKAYFNDLSEEQIKTINEAESKDIDISDVKFDSKMTILKETFGISRNLPLNSSIKRENLIDVKKEIEIKQKEKESEIKQIEENDEKEKPKVELEEPKVEVQEVLKEEDNSINEINETTANLNEITLTDNENNDKTVDELIPDKVNEDEDEDDEYNLGYKKVTNNENEIIDQQQNNKTEDEKVKDNDNDNDNEKLLEDN